MSEKREGIRMSKGENEHSQTSTGNSIRRNHIVKECHDMADTFDHLKVYFDNKTVDFKSDCFCLQDVVLTKVKKRVSRKLKHKQTVK